jgi:hypothetical protein
VQQNRLAFRRQVDPPAEPLKEFYVQGVFQVLDLNRHGRLTDAQSFGRFGKAALARDAKKDLKLMEIDFH